MNREIFSSVVAVSGLIGAGAGLSETGYVFMQQGVPSQPAQPQQPSSPNRPQNPAPNQPAQNQPAQNQQPGQRPANSLPQDRKDDRREHKPGETAQQRAAMRPFAFQSTQAEAKFNESAQRLTQMEQRMQKSNQEMLRRLGEARALSGDRQSVAVMELLQQFLTEQTAMQQYLVQSRQAITGDVSEEGTDPAEMTPRNQPGTDADRPSTPDLAPRTPDQAPRTPPIAPGNPR